MTAEKHNNVVDISALSVPKRRMLPFSIEVDNPTPQELALQIPVTSLDFYEHAGGQLADNGLFSTVIFGRIGSDERDLRFSYAKLHTRVFHPAIFEALVTLKALYAGILNSTLYARWDTKLKDFVADSELNGRTGFAFFMEHWKDIEFKRTKSASREDKILTIEKYKDIAVIDHITISPAGIRDIEEGDNGRPTVNVVNEYYRSIIGAANTMADNPAMAEDPMQDRTRMRIQQSIADFYNYYLTILSGKRGWMANRWGSRRVALGTRNVMVARNGNDAELGGRRMPRFTDTVVGLYQVAIAMLPMVVYWLRTGYLDPIFNHGDGQARLVNRKTLKAEMVELPTAIFDKWTTTEGLERVVSGLSEPHYRLMPCKVDTHYLALIYIGPDMTFRVFSDIDELPSHLNRKHVHPINYATLIYLAGYRHWNGNTAQNTRYPVTGTGSIFVATQYVMTTTVGEGRYELDENWEKIGEDHFALEFPKPGLAMFMDGVAVATPRLDGMGGDYDGDTATHTVLLTEEANKQNKAYLNSANAYVDPRGGLRTSLSTSVVNWVLAAITD